MSTPIERIPIPWPQRRELLRERFTPVLCFIATVTACAALWQYQASVVPVVVGKVHGDFVELVSPVDGKVLAVGSDASADAWPLFAELERGAIAARIEVVATPANPAGTGAAAPAIAKITTPLAGKVTVAPTVTGQQVRRGDSILTITSPLPAYILCHLPYQWRQPPAAGAEVAIREKRRGVPWVKSTIAAIGPAVESAPEYPGLDATIRSRGVPLRISLPKGLDLTPGALVEVRFGAMSGK
jgi:hypothetical protein